MDWLTKLTKLTKLSFTWQTGPALHPVCFLSVAQPADVVTQRFDVVDTLRHHQVLMDQVAAVGSRLGEDKKGCVRMASSLMVIHYT